MSTTLEPSRTRPHVGVGMATATTHPPRVQRGGKRQPMPPPTVSLYDGDGPSLLRQVRRDHDIRHQPHVDELVETFFAEAGLVPGALCSCDKVMALFAPFVRLVGTAVIRDASRISEARAPLPGHPVTQDEVDAAEPDDADPDEPDDEGASEHGDDGCAAGGKPPTTSGKSSASSKGGGRNSASKDTGKSSKAAPADPIAERRKALAVTFFTGADWVSWGDATVEDHEARIEYLSRKVDGLEATIAKHVEAVALIEAAGAQCLADLETTFVP